MSQMTLFGSQHYHCNQHDMCWNWESGTVPTGTGTRTGTVPYLGSQRGVLLDVVLPLEVDVHVARGVVGPAERARHLGLTISDY